MKASDTVMRQKNILAGLDKTNILGQKVLGDDWTPIQVRGLLEAQAAITWDIAFRAGIKEVVEQIKAQTINAKRNASEVYEAHKQLKPRDKQSEARHNGYDSALQDLIDFLQSKLKEWGIK